MHISPVSDDANNEVSAVQQSKFSHVQALPPDAIFHTKARYKADTDPRKINLGIGAYRTDDGKPYILDVVRQAEAALLKNPSLNKEYLPIGGDAEFILASQQSILGDCAAIKEGRVAEFKVFLELVLFEFSATSLQTISLEPRFIRVLLPGEITERFL